MCLVIFSIFKHFNTHIKGIQVAARHHLVLLVNAYTANVEPHTAPSKSLHLSHLRLVILLLHQRLNIPDGLRVLVDAPVTREEAHARHREDGLGRPRLRVLVRLVDQLLSVHIRGKVVRDKVVVAVLDDAVEQCAEGPGVAKASFVDLIEDLGELGFELVVVVEMRVA